MPFRRHERIKSVNNVWLNHINIKRKYLLAYNNAKTTEIKK